MKWGRGGGKQIFNCHLNSTALNFYSKIKSYQLITRSCNIFFLMLLAVETANLKPCFVEPKLHHTTPPTYQLTDATGHVLIIHRGDRTLMTIPYLGIDLMYLIS